MELAVTYLQKSHASVTLFAGAYKTIWKKKRANLPHLLPWKFHDIELTDVQQLECLYHSPKIELISRKLNPTGRSLLVSRLVSYPELEVLRTHQLPGAKFPNESCTLERTYSCHYDRKPFQKFRHVEEKEW